MSLMTIFKKNSIFGFVFRPEKMIFQMELLSQVEMDKIKQEMFKYFNEKFENHAQK